MMKNIQLTGSALKLVAITSMLIDHIAMFLLHDETWAKCPLFTWGDTDISIYWLMRAVGRMAFPIFCFLLVEGYIYTRNKLKYGWNLLLFALLSELPWNLLFGGTYTHETQNVFFSLLLGYLSICCVEYWEDDYFNIIITCILIPLLALLVNADYGIGGVFLILIMYYFRNYRSVSIIIGCLFIDNSFLAMLSIIPIFLYNGKRGFIQNIISKYFFYAFYPVHLWYIYIISFCI